MGWKEELDRFLGDFEKETDRAAVILAAAKIDELLRLAIIGRLRPSTASRDDLLQPEGPIGSLRARIDIAFRLGLIDGAFVRALHLVRKIRNDFAHESSSASLASGAHSDRVRELALPWRNILEQLQAIPTPIPGVEVSTPRGQFAFMVGYILVRLNEVIKHGVELENLPHPLGIFMEPVVGKDKPEGAEQD